MVVIRSAVAEADADPLELESLPPGVTDVVTWQRGNDLAHRARIYLENQDWSRARDALTEAIALFEQTGDDRQQAACLGGLGDVAVGQNDLRAALQHYEDASALARRVKYPEVEALSLFKAAAIWPVGG